MLGNLGTTRGYSEYPSCIPPCRAVTVWSGQHCEAVAHDSSARDTCCEAAAHDSSSRDMLRGLPSLHILFNEEFLVKKLRTKIHLPSLFSWTSVSALHQTTSVPITWFSNGHHSRHWCSTGKGREAELQYLAFSIHFHWPLVTQPLCRLPCRFVNALSLGLWTKM